MSMVIFSVVFGTFAKLPSEGIPYPIFTYVALLPWQFFAGAAQTSATSLLNQRHIISKVYFPRLVIPISAVLSAGVGLVLDGNADAVYAVLADAAFADVLANLGPLVGGQLTVAADALLAGRAVLIVDALHRGAVIAASGAQSNDRHAHNR